VVTATQVKSWTAKDPILYSDELKPYKSRRSELSIHDGCLLWDTQMIIAPPGRAAMIEQLHESHPGICKMKSLARSYVCDVCKHSRPSDRPIAIHPWEWPQKPWSRLHVDYASPLFGKMYMILVDSHSKGIEAKTFSSATSAATIEHLTSIFFCPWNTRSINQ